MADLSTYASAAVARSGILTDPGSALAGIENGDGVDITNRIVDSGSNSDGYWYQFANGILVNWNNDLILSGLSSNGGSDNWPLPKGYGNTNYFAGCSGADGATSAIITPWPSSQKLSNSVRFRVNQNVSTRELHVVAIGIIT